MTEASPPAGPDLAAGLDLAQLADGGMVLGRVGDEAVLLARRGDDIFAIGAICTHYGGPLGDGLLVGDTVRCPWHHACFSLRTGQPLRPPALNPVDCWRVERRDGMVYVREKRQPAPLAAPAIAAGAPRSIVILGGGGAGNTAAETLRREGYAGRLVMVSANSSVPCDRPNLSKDYLAGTAPEEWIPLRPPEFYREHDIELHLDARAASIDRKGRRLVLESGGEHSYDMLLLATGAEPVRLGVAGGDLPHVCYLRSLADSRAIIGKAASARSAVVIGASFIGLEAAAALRARNLEVHVAAPEEIPMARIIGPEIGGFVRALHEEHGVRFHLGTTVAAIEPGLVRLANGQTLAADLVVVGIGVRPALDLAQRAGLDIDRGVVVDRHLRTSDPAIFAAGDIARWPDPHTGDNIRVEHWVVAERQGQTAARNMIGRRVPFDAVPFFWSMHYDTSILYVGHAERWDAIEIDGRPQDRDCRATYRRDGRALAVVTIGRDAESLRAERALEEQA